MRTTGLLAASFAVTVLAADDPRPGSAVPPVASFEATPTSGFAPLVVQFTDHSLGEIDAWSWDFGDGFGTSVQNPSHTYTESGVYSVSLTVSGAGGSDTLTLVNLISVDPLPPGFVDELVTDTLSQTTGFLVRSDDDLVVWQKEGKVWRWVQGNFCPEPLVDISEEVANWSDHGLHGFAFDPDYETNGHVYLYYVVDRHHLDHFGTPRYDPQGNDFEVETIGRVTRFTAFDPADPATRVDPASRTVLVGEDAASGIPICDATHGVGYLAFGHDGSLLFSCGDSSLGLAPQPDCLPFMRPAEDVGPFRSQLLESAAGKIHRIDPSTGDGHPTNPFYDAGAPRSWASRVWALGLRNPYRFAVRPDEDGGPEHGDGPGTLFVGDVGSSKWEEISVVSAGGANLGWPFYETYEAQPTLFGLDEPNQDAPNPLFPQDGCVPFFLFEDLLVEDSLHPPSWPNPCDGGQAVPASIPTFVHERPAVAWSHGDEGLDPSAFVKDYDANGDAILVGLGERGSPVAGTSFVGNASIGGTWLGGRTFPPPFRDVYFHADYGEGWIRAFAFDREDHLTAVHDFADSTPRVTFLTTGPEQDALYYLRYHSPPSIRRIRYGGNAKPVAAIEAAPDHGALPLRVELSAAGSSDPEGRPLRFAWDFGDNGRWTPLRTLAETVHLYPSEDVTSSVLAVFASSGPGQELSSRHVASLPLAAPSAGAPERLPIDGGGPPYGTLGVISDKVWPPVGTLLGAPQLVVRGSPLQLLLAEERELVGLILQEGLALGPAGGWLEELRVEVVDPVTLRWVAVEALRTHPVYPGNRSLGYETFRFDFDPVRTRAVRLRDAAAGASRFTVAELRVIALPRSPPTGPTTYVPTVTLTDDEGAVASVGTLVSMNNTPPAAEILSPAPGQTYPVGVESEIPLLANLADAEHDVGSLACEWSVELVHGNHVHPEPPDDACATTLVLLPHGELEGDVVYWRIRLRVTDPEGLSTTVVRDLLPEGDCNRNGLDDALDLASSTSRDRNANGVPDECEAFPASEVNERGDPAGGR